MNKKTSFRQKVFELHTKAPIEPFSVYEVTFNYTSEENYTADIVLTYQGQRLVSQFSRKFVLEKGNNKAKINVTTETFMEPVASGGLLHINPVDSKGFAPDAPLTNPVSTGVYLDKFLKIEHESIQLTKIFDLRYNLSNSKYQILTTKGPATNDKPVILHGYYLREDGLGAHLPNLFDNVFYDRKNVAFSRQINRHQLHFSFINRIQEFSERGIEPYTKDFSWMRYYYSRENKHYAEKETFRNADFIHVGGFDLNSWDLQRDIKMVTSLKARLNITSYMYLMWESTGVEKLASIIKVFDHIVVTNHWLKDLIEKKLNHKNVHVVEHIAKYFQASEVEDKYFNFGYSGGLWERKGVDKLIRAFNRIKSKDTKLRIHSRDFVNVPAMLQRVNGVISESPDNIELVNRTLSNEEYSHWWNTLNCFVFISAGESYSIQPRQALMNGIPVILSKNTSHLDLLDVPGILWVDTEAATGAEFSGQPNDHLDTGKQFPVSVENTTKAMREVIKNYSHWKEQAMKARAILAPKVDPINVKKQWDNLLKEGNV